VSLPACVTIGVLAACAAICLAGLGLSQGPNLPNGTWPAFAAAGFWAVVAVACLAPRTRPVTLRVIGAAVFGFYAAYVVVSFDSKNVLLSLVSLVGCTVFGIPSVYVLVRGRYPSWGLAARAFITRDGEANKEDGPDRRTGDSSLGG
jgi:hypothetical protein